MNTSKLNSHVRLLVFVGNTAALSFHHFLRKILKRYAGPSNFTESQSRRMLEVDIPDSEDGSFHDSLDEEEKRALIQHFLDAVRITGLSHNGRPCSPSISFIF